MDYITKEMFEAYVSVQMSGKYNMLMNAHEAADEAGLSIADYMAIIKNYSELKKKFA